jgi:hypothetical protein
MIVREYENKCEREGDSEREERMRVNKKRAR